MQQEELNEAYYKEEKRLDNEDEDELMSEVTSCTEQSEYLGPIIRYTQRITQKQRKAMKRARNRGPHNLLEIQPQQSILKPEVLKKLKIDLLCGKNTNTIIDDTPQNELIQQIIYEHNHKPLLNLNIENSKLNEDIDNLCIEAPDKLKRQTTAEHIQKLKQERLEKKLIKKQKKLVLNTKLTSDITNDMNLSANFLARLMVDFSSFYNIIPDNINSSNSTESCVSCSESESESIICESNSKKSIKIQEKQIHSTSMVQSKSMVEEEENESIPDIIPCFSEQFSTPSCTESIFGNTNSIATDEYDSFLLENDLLQENITNNTLQAAQLVFSDGIHYSTSSPILGTSTNHNSCSALAIQKSPPPISTINETQINNFEFELDYQPFQ